MDRHAGVRLIQQALVHGVLARDIRVADPQFSAALACSCCWTATHLSPDQPGALTGASDFDRDRLPQGSADEKACKHRRCDGALPVRDADALQVVALEAPDRRNGQSGDPRQPSRPPTPRSPRSARRGAHANPRRTGPSIEHQNTEASRTLALSADVKAIRRGMACGTNVDLAAAKTKLIGERQRRRRLWVRGAPGTVRDRVCVDRVGQLRQQANAAARPRSSTMTGSTSGKVSSTAGGRREGASMIGKPVSLRAPRRVLTQRRP